MVEVVATGEFAGWYGSLDPGDTRTVDRLVGLLEGQGVALGAPYSSAIKGAKIALRELRATGSEPLRIFYAFDPERRAVLLVGGNKKGDGRFYQRNVRLAEKVWAGYLQERKP